MIGGRYSREREIGRGGMGAVWLGRDEVLGRPVAIKRVGVMPGGSSPDLLRAEREARIAASLNHPHVVGIFDLVHDEDHQWLVMEYVEGVTLAELVRDRGALPAHEAAALLTQAASALAAAHEAGIIHRDVKPSNILVRPDGQVKISDFGIARAEADASLTQTGLVTGSPAYLAPEVASGRLAGPASDVWSLGATLYHALSGHPPYDVGDNVLGALYRIVNEPPPRLPDAGVMSSVLAATMTQDPESRWSMVDVARFFERASRLDATVVREIRSPDTEPDTGPDTDPDPELAPPPDPAPDPAPATSDGDEPDAGTQVLPTPPVEPAPAPTPAPKPQTKAIPQAREHRGAASRRPGTLPMVIGFVVLALVVVIVLLALADDPQDAPAVVPTDDTGAPSDTTSSDSSSDAPQPTKNAMTQFVSDYIETASTDSSAGFDRLTPAYQQESGGFSGYDGFWGDVTNASVDTIEADPADLTVTYTYTYETRGAGSTTEEVTLQLVQDGDGFLIDGAT